MQDLPPLPPLPALPPACLNCDASLPAPRPRFCPMCGQETNLKPPRIGEFVQQFGGAYLSTEGALWRTLKLLLLKPGELTRQYLAGRRKHYVLPLRLYLTISVVVLLMFRLLAAASLEAPGAVQMDPQDLKNLQINIVAGVAGLKDGVFFCNGLPDWLCKRVQRRIDLDPAAVQGAVRQLGERFVANLGASLFVLLPAFALWLKWVYLSRGLRYTEHLVFALHVHAFWFLAIGVGLLPWPWVGGVMWLVVPVYTLLAMRTVYGGRWWPRLLRATVVSLLYSLTLAVAMLGLSLFVFLT